MAVENGASCQQSATYDGREYQMVREGLAEILKPRSPTEQTGDGPMSQTVFYNPIQQFNRDLSVLAIRAFAEDLAIIRRRREERASGKAKHRGNKRKRPDEGQHAEHATTPSGKLQKASIDGEQQTNGIPEELDNNSNAVNWAPTGKSSFAPI
jgi:tRNA (guanine26-N2/guanine27-N2)-dimethyltransferase